MFERCFGCSDEGHIQGLEIREGEQHISLFSFFRCIRLSLNRKLSSASFSQIKSALGNGAGHAIPLWQKIGIFVPKICPHVSKRVRLISFTKRGCFYLKFCLLVACESCTQKHLFYCTPSIGSFTYSIKSAG